MATPEEIAAAKEGLTSDQLKWLGGADPTDPFIRARGKLPPLPNQVTVPSQADVRRFEKYAQSSNDVDPSLSDISVDDLNPSSIGISENSNTRINNLKNQLNLNKFQITPEPEIVFGNNARDMRVKIKIPSLYYNSIISNKKIKNLTAIIFPYTPIITYDMYAEYTSQTPTHSNFSINFYKNSTIKSIQINGKFTVETIDDAEMYISTTQLIKSLIRMRSNNDINAGSPPPVCRLEGYGDAMLKNIPIAITNFKIELQDDVDYFNFESKIFGINSVPTRSTLSLSCIPMYSRNEMMNFSVQGYLNNNLQRKGYL